MPNNVRRVTRPMFLYCTVSEVENDMKSQDFNTSITCSPVSIFNDTGEDGISFSSYKTRIVGV